MELYTKYIKNVNKKSNYIKTTDNRVIPENIQNVIKKILPETELCNEIFLHNKVYKGHYDICKVMPNGRKCLLWFKMNKNIPVTYILNINPRKKQILKIENACISFSKFLTNGLYGTLLYGTLSVQQLNKQEQQFFIIEDIKYYKGENLQHIEQINKVKYYNDLFHNYINNDLESQKREHKLICRLPYMFSMDTYSDDMISKLNNYYQIFSIQYIKSNKIFVKKYENNRKMTFIIKPQLQNDIYDVYRKNQVTGNIEYIDIAFIPDYKTSVMMNNYYRTIRENDCLDYLEESEDEEYFENVNIDKFVNLSKQCIFECSFNKKFKKWVPVKYIEDL